LSMHRLMAAASMTLRQFASNALSFLMAFFAFTARRDALLPPHDWLTYCLVGEYLTDPGDASGTGYYTPASGQWDAGLLSLVDNNVDWSERLPRLLGYEESAGIVTNRAAGELGLGLHTVVGPGTADNQAAALGMGVRTGDVVVSLGTKYSALTEARGK